jgi:hypothetical protein
MLQKESHPNSNPYNNVVHLRKCVRSTLASRMERNLTMLRMYEGVLRAYAWCRSDPLPQYVREDIYVQTTIFPRLMLHVKLEVLVP